MQQADGSVCFLKEHFPSAFSHYTYVASRRNEIVVDLQGVLTSQDVEKGPWTYRLTDPCIHSKGADNDLSVTGAPVHKMGRSDRGTRGMDAFFSTHTCNDVCRALGLRRPACPACMSIGKCGQCLLEPHKVGTCNGRPCVSPGNCMDCIAKKEAL